MAEIQARPIRHHRPQWTRSADSAGYKKCRPEFDGAVDHLVERNLLALAQNYLEARRIEVVAAEILPGEVADMNARFIDTRRIPCDLCMFALDADVLQVAELGTGAPDMILELLQSREFGIRTKRLEHMVAEMPGLP